MDLPDIVEIVIFEDILKIAFFQKKGPNTVLGGPFFKSNFKEILKNEYFKDIWYIHSLPYD